MIRSRVFVFLAIALFLAGCLCAEATAPSAEVADEGTAKAKVTELQALTKEVLEKAETKLRGAQSAKRTAGDQKRKSENAESAVRTAAAEIKAGNRKAQADAIVRTAAEVLGKCNNLYEDANNKAETASVFLNAFLTRARDLENKAKNEIPSALSQSANYAQAIQSAAAVTSDTQRLNGEIDNSKALSDAESALFPLKGSAVKVQVFKYQAESLAIVSRIETNMSEAATVIQSIQQTKENIDTIVQEMDKTFQSAPDSSKGFLSSLCNNAGGFLRTATSQVKEANKCNTDMQGKKTQLDGTLKTLMDRTDEETDAGGEAERVKWHEGHINVELQTIQQALRAAENAFNSAKGAQKQMLDEMSKNNSQSGTKLNEGNTQDNVRTAEVTKPIQNGEVKNPKITEIDQTALANFKETMEKMSEQPIDANLDKTKQTKSTQLTHNEKQNPKDDKSELLNKDQLRNITKDITNNPLIGGEVPTRSAANDSAVTVFIPLLVIVVISAVLH